MRLWRSEAGDQGDGGACLFRWGAPSVPCVHSRQVVWRAASAVQRTRRNAGRPLPGTCRFRPGGPASPRTPASCGHAFSGCLVHMAEHRGDADERFARVRARLGPSGRPATDGVRFPPEALGHDASASAPGLNDEFHVRGAVPVVHGLFEQFVRRRLFPQPCRGAQMPPRLSPALAAQRGPDVAQIGQSGRELPWLPEARRRRPAGRRAAARRKTWACCCGDTTGRRKAPRG